MAKTIFANANGLLLGEKTDSGVNIDYVPDALGSIVAAVNQNLTTTYTAAYSPFGSLLASTGTAPFVTWNGINGYLSVAGGMYAEFFVRNRFYTSVDATWISSDLLWP